MSPVEPSRELREKLQHEIEQNRRWEARLPWYAAGALLVLALIVVVRVVWFS
ncbi:hypothetical protein [Leifsonia sp. AG29]|uniref:hypothetical protein n=1 Tax=Leifsonia sp. AG29 TaxID=2598860 RepID=UPI0018EEEE2E|nr:hypothetical protein [Leifsonia sp. AG29]